MKPISPHNAWREHEAYCVPLTEEGEHKAQRRLQTFTAGFNAAIEAVINMMEVQHETVKGRHNHWRVAANLVKSEFRGECE